MPGVVQGLPQQDRSVLEQGHTQVLQCKATVIMTTVEGPNLTSRP